MSKRVDIHLPYFKQGDDLASFLENKPQNPSLAMREHAAMLRETAEFLDKAADIVSGVPTSDIDIQADTHFIGLEAPDAVCDALLATGYACPSFTEDDDEDDDLEAGWDDELVAIAGPGVCAVDCESCQ